MKCSKWLALAPLALVAGAHAGTVYDNGLPNTSNGYGIFQTEETADDFVIAGGASITKVAFYFQNYNGIAGWNQDLTYQFLADVSSQPGAPIATGSAQNLVAADSGLPWCCGGNAFLVTFDLQAPFTAAAGTRYWLGLTGATGGTAAWWVTTDSNATPTGWVGSQGNLSPGTSEQFAFSLSGDSTGGSTPEPATFVLIGGGLAAAGLLRSLRPSF